MKKISGSIANYFVTFHLPALLLAIGISGYFLYIQGGFDPIDFIFLIPFIAMNIICIRLFYGPFYRRKISVLLQDGDTLWLDDLHFAIQDIQSVRLLKMYEYRNSLQYYIIKIKSGKGYRYFNIVTRVSFIDILFFLPHDPEQDQTIKALREMGFKRLIIVSDVSLHSFPFLGGL